MPPFHDDPMREDFQKIGWALVLSQMTMTFLSLLLSLAASALLYLFSPLQSTWAWMEGWIMILSAAGGLLPMLTLCLRTGGLEGLLIRREKIWPVQVVFYFLMVLGLQMLTSIACSPIVALLESAGASFEQATTVATSYSLSWSILFYSVLAAPVIEELIYRGALLHALEPYGRWFAIGISALIFGLMHGNAVQFPVALVIGLVFGYLALKYSLKLTIVLHVLNNLSVELIGRLSAVSERLGAMLNGSLMLAGVAALFLLALSGGKPLLRDFRASKTPHTTYRQLFTTLPVAAIFLYMIAMTVSSVLL